jgi:predicted methyltransferase
MKPLTQLAHEEIAKILKPGHIAIDLTAGNGQDALFLARCVGPTGHVYAFDIQPAAIQATQQRLNQQTSRSDFTLVNGSHANWIEAIPAEHRIRIKAAMMNLGYLPGGDKSIVTQAASTLAAIQIALDWLQPGGVISILAYRGHPGGQTEANAVEMMLDELDPKAFEIIREPAKAASQNPVLNLVYIKDES